MADVARARAAFRCIVNMHDVELARRFADAHRRHDRRARSCTTAPPRGSTDDDLKPIYGGEDWLQ